MEDNVDLSIGEYMALSYILVAIFYHQIGKWEKDRAKELLNTINSRWLKMMAGANLDQAEETGRLIAEEFCVEYLESLGYKVKLERESDGSNNVFTMPTTQE